MTTTQVVETSVTVNNNSPIQDYVHLDDQTQPTFEMTPGFKPFTLLILFCVPKVPMGFKTKLNLPDDNYYVIVLGHKVTVCGDNSDNPTCLCVQHSPPLPFECTSDCISKISVSVGINIWNTIIYSCKTINGQDWGKYHELSSLTVLLLNQCLLKTRER